MEFLTTLREIISPETIVKAGYVIMALVIFAETGLLAGFFLPGDSMLITAGIFSARGDLDLLTLNVILSACAIAGDATGYYIGRKLGDTLFEKKDTYFFKKKYISQTKEFYEKHGGKTIILARFIPIIRTFAPTLAGVGKMHYLRFAQYNIFGGIFWIVSLTSAGHLLGALFPNVVKQLEFVIAIVVAVSVAPIAWKLIQSLLEKIRT